MVAKELGLHGAVGVGHSLGGHAMALAAAMEPAAFSSLLLVDPVIQMPDRYDGHAKGVEFIGRRRARWKSVEEMVRAIFAKIPIFKLEAGDFARLLPVWAASGGG